jgi:hypothetical protein
MREIGTRETSVRHRDLSLVVGCGWARVCRCGCGWRGLGLFPNFLLFVTNATFINEKTEKVIHISREKRQTGVS